MASILPCALLGDPLLTGVYKHRTEGDYLSRLPWSDMVMRCLQSAEAHTYMYACPWSNCISAMHTVQPRTV
jgi:hypothetical protein